MNFNNLKCVSWFLTNRNPKIATLVLNRAGVHRCLFLRMAAVIFLGYSGRRWKIPWAQREAQGDLERRRGNSFSPVFSPHSAGHHYPYSYLSQAARNQKICWFFCLYRTQWLIELADSTIKYCSKSILFSITDPLLHISSFPFFKTRVVNILDHCQAVSLVLCAMC